MRSANSPATTHPIAPHPIIRNEEISAGTDESPRAARLARIITGIHAHIAYNSHMCPKYPKLASRTPRFLNTCNAWFHLNRAAATACGPSPINTNTIKPPMIASIEINKMFCLQLALPSPLTK
jgi:hypothetical protein